jgi:hypothetical protein
VKFVTLFSFLNGDARKNPHRVFFLPSLKFIPGALAYVIRVAGNRVVRLKKHDCVKRDDGSTSLMNDA